MAARPLNINEINNLLSLEENFDVPVEVREEVEKTVQACVAKLSKHYGRELWSPAITYDLSGHTAGYAVRNRNATPIEYTIRLNAEILMNPKHQEDMFSDTIPHEVAHIAVMQFWPTAQAHGNIWASVMHVLGVEPTRCHQYETRAARTHKKPHTYYCLCGPHKISTLIRDRMVVHGRTYRCKRCGYPLQKEPYS